VVGAISQSLTRMDTLGPDVLMFVMTHGTVVTNLIPLNVAQAGLVTSRLDNALLPTQEMDLVASLLAHNIATPRQAVTHTDATLPAISAISVEKMIRVVARIGRLNVEDAMTQILQQCINVIGLTQIIHSARHVRRIRLRAASQELLHVTVALHHHSSLHVTLRHSAVNRPITLEISNRPVMQLVDTSLHKNSWVLGEDSWLRKVNPKCLTWVRLTWCLEIRTLL